MGDRQNCFVKREGEERCAVDGIFFSFLNYERLFILIYKCMLGSLFCSIVLVYF